MKKFLAIILCVSMMAGMCAFALAEEQITLNFQMWSDEEEVFTELIRIYEEAHPNIKINMTCTPSGDSYSVKLSTVLGGGGDVDMFGISSPPGLAEYVAKGAVMPLDELIAAGGNDMSGIQSIVDSILIDGKVYGLPYKTSSWFVVYNKDIFDAAGVPYPTGAWTWEEFFEIGKKLTSGEGNDKIYGVLNFQPTSMWWRVPANSMGATNPLVEDELKAWMRAAEFCKSMSDAGIQPLYEDMAGDSGADYSGNFLQGKYGMVYNGDWIIEMLNTAIRNGDGNVNYDIAPLPHWEGEKAVTPGAAGILMVAEGTQHAKEAYDFIAFCTGAEASKTFLSMDYFPAWQDENTVATYCEGKTAPEHIEFVVNQDIISQVPCDPLYNPATNIVKEEVSLYLLGEQDIETTEANCLARIKDEVVDAQ